MEKDKTKENNKEGRKDKRQGRKWIELKAGRKRPKDYGKTDSLGNKSGWTRQARREKCGDKKKERLQKRSLHGMAPRYVMDLLSTKPEGRHHLRSDDRGLLQIPKTNRAFAHAAPSIWNLLPFDIRQCETVNSFKTKLKTFLFRKAFNIAS